MAGGSIEGVGRWSLGIPRLAALEPALSEEPARAPSRMGALARDDRGVRRGLGRDEEAGPHDPIDTWVGKV